MQRRSTGRFPIRLVLAVLLAAVLVIVVVQNSQTATVEFLFWDIEGPLVWLLSIVAALGLLAGLLWPRSWKYGP